jgi:hypothetical protein
MGDINALRRVLEYAESRRVAGDGRGSWSTDRERREVPRYDYRVEGTAELVHRPEGTARGLEPGFPVITLSLSRGGMAFLANHELSCGDRIEVTLPTTDTTGKRYRVTVVRCRRAGLNAFEIGAVFEAGDEAP